jgi:hypothetical protein
VSFNFLQFDLELSENTITLAVPAADTENFIIGGHPTWIQNFPHQVSLRPWWNSDFHFCGTFE